MSVIDNEGQQLFNDPGDVKLLRKRNWDRIQEVADRVMEFNGMSHQAVAAVAKN